MWFWQLVPANPILVRVVHGASKRPRHLWLRMTYLGVILIVVLFSLVTSLSAENASLAELAKRASTTFQYASMTQLALMCFLAPVFTASAITQERDAQTFNILLSTPLTNAQIVFGSLMSRLYFVLTLLVAGLPIFLLTMVYGGVTTSQIVESFALSGSTAILTGALAIFIAMLGVGTRRTIFSFYLVIALYLLCVYLLGYWWSNGWVEVAPANVNERKMSILTAIHPFLALEVALNTVPAPAYGHLGGYPSLMRFALAYPSAMYVIWTTVLAFILTVAAILFVRSGAKTGEATFLNSLADRFRRQPLGELRRPPRTVWNNPVAWREARTRASGGRVLRWVIVLAGFLGPLALFIDHASGGLTASAVPQWIAALVMVQFGLALIIATNTAATSMTKEKEAKTMDLLLTTPLSSKYILWGKLRGLVSFAVPLLAGPVVVLLLFGLFSLLGGASPPVVWIETALELGCLLIIYTAVACVIALWISLTSRKNVTAVMYSVGLMVVLCGVASLVFFPLVGNLGGEGGVFLAPFTPFTAIQFLVHPAPLFGNASQFSQGLAAARIAGVLGTVIAVGLYTVIVWRIYSGIVRNFDMTLRKQSGL
jgi:ABC-type transport system involved in multi-copper enzyme maturation permease subunit